MYCGTQFSKTLFFKQVKIFYDDGGDSPKKYSPNPYPRVVNSAEVVVLLSGYHEGRQVRRVHGEEDDGKQRPDAAHEPTGSNQIYNRTSLVLCYLA